MVKFGRTHTAVILVMDDPPGWAKWSGIDVERVEQEQDGRIIVSFQRCATDSRYRNTGSPHPSGGTKFQWTRKELLDQLPPFGQMDVKVLENNEAGIQIEVPAERQPVMERRPMTKRAKKPSTAVATVREQVKTMSRESPPPDFKPAIPLREAVDTINAYKAEEGDALELSFSRRGRLKVKYEYGG